MVRSMVRLCWGEGRVYSIVRRTRVKLGYLRKGEEDVISHRDLSHQNDEKMTLEFDRNVGGSAGSIEGGVVWNENVPCVVDLAAVEPDLDDLPALHA